MEFLMFVAGGAVGALIVFLFLKEKVSVARTEATLKAEQLKQFQENLPQTFKALSADALQTNNQSFLELAKSQIDPLKTSLEKVDIKIQELEKNRATTQATLAEQIKMLSEGSQQLKLETANLSKALRAPNVRGRWGEIQLKRVVEMAGMLNYCDFEEQTSVSTEEGRFRPDLLVKLPGGKTIVVDAKAPISAYLEALECPTEEARAERIAAHARHVKDHLTKLGSKSYWSQFNPSPEFVVLFLPGETFFSAALEQDPSLIEFGVNQQVILATPTTLIALLRAVAYGWRQENLAENAKHISDLGRELYERIRTMGGHFNVVGTALNRAVESYNKTLASFETRVLTGARKFKELGAASGEEIPTLEVIERTSRELTGELKTSDEAAPGSADIAKA